MDRNHIACRSANSLGGNYHRPGNSERLRNAKLELAEHHVADGVGAGQERTERTDGRCQQRVDAADAIGDIARHDDWHTGQLGAVDAGVDQDAHHRHGEQQYEAGAEQHAAGFLHGSLELGNAHAVQEKGNQHHHDQDAAWQIQRFNAGIDAGFTEDVGKGDGYRFQRGRDLREHAADHQNRADQHVGQPGTEGAHRARRDVVQLHFDGAQPFGRPFFGVGEVPGGLRRQELEAGSGGNDRQPHQAAEQRREFRAEEDAGGSVGQGERQAGEDRERQYFEAGFPAFLLAEEARQHQHHDQRHYCADDGVGDRHTAGDLLQVGVPAGPLRNQLRADGGGIQAAVDAHDDRRTDRAERHRRALHQHAEQDCSHCREADRNQQRCGDGGRSAKAGSALDEATEQPGDDDGLDAAVRADGGETGTNGGDAAGMLEGVQQQDCAEDDPQQAQGDHQTLQRRGDDAVNAHVPDEQPDGCGEQEDQRHGAAGGPAQTDQHDCCEQNGCEGE